MNKTKKRMKIERRVNRNRRTLYGNGKAPVFNFTEDYNRHALAQKGYMVANDGATSVALAVDLHAHTGKIVKDTTCAIVRYVSTRIEPIERFTD